MALLIRGARTSNQPVTMLGVPCLLRVAGVMRLILSDVRFSAGPFVVVTTCAHLAQGLRAPSARRTREPASLSGVAVACQIPPAGSAEQVRCARRVIYL